MRANLAKLIEWQTLKGNVYTHTSFQDNVMRESTLWYFCAIDGDRTITLNYRKYGERLVLYKHITVEQDRGDSGRTGRVVYCRTVKELFEVLNEV